MVGRCTINMSSEMVEAIIVKYILTQVDNADNLDVNFKVNSETRGYGTNEYLVYSFDGADITFDKELSGITSRIG